jgi:hypothetical protein
LMLFLLLAIFSIHIINAQTEQTMRRAAQGKVGANQDELVSFKDDVPYTKAIQSLGELSKKFDGKLVIDRSALSGKDKKIGVNIEAMYWKDALELILRSNQLWYNDYAEYLEIVPFDAVGKQSVSSSPGGAPSVAQNASAIPLSGSARSSVDVDSSTYYSQIREVSISTVFFDLNKTKLNESGMDFSIFRGSNMNLGVNLYGSTYINTEGKSVSRLSDKVSTVYASPRSSDLGVTMDAAFSILESDNLGEVIARPQMTVRSGSTSRFQVGQDFSVLEKDFSGNTVQKFYPTGTILTVRPKVYKVGDMDFIDVQYTVEKSTFTSSTATTVINKTSSAGSLTFLNGEEGYVAGMYSTEETTVR